MKVYIHNGSLQYVQLFMSLGHEVVGESESEVVVFTGGSDVNPVLYGQTFHPYTRTDLNRDEDDIKCYTRNLYKPKLGICRGAQFLHVMNGGTLYQDVDNHAIRGRHLLTCKSTGKEWEVTSTHHQMMRPDAGVVVGVAKETSYADTHVGYELVREEIVFDVEVVFHPKAMCFQPHPEFHGEISTKDCFNHFLNMFMEDRV